MNWLDKKTWKQCFIATFICLLGCSTGAMGATFLLIDTHWALVLLISVIAGFITCMILMVIWHMLYDKMNFIDSFKHSYKMSIVSILIMILTENLVLLVIAPKLLNHHLHMNSAHGIGIMFLAMSVGFFLSLPYNYYQLQKTGKLCH